MTRTVDGIRMWINGAEPEHGRTLEHANAEVRTLLAALDEATARAEALRTTVAEQDSAMMAASLNHLDVLVQAGRLAERDEKAEARLAELREELVQLERWMLFSEPMFSSRDNTAGEERKACGRRLGIVLAKALGALGKETP